MRSLERIAFSLLFFSLSRTSVWVLFNDWFISLVDVYTSILSTVQTFVQRYVERFPRSLKPIFSLLALAGAKDGYCSGGMMCVPIFCRSSFRRPL